MQSLRDLRLQKFMTQKQLAERLEVPYQMVQRWEAGKAFPRPASMAKLAEVLEVSGEDLLAILKAGVMHARTRVTNGTVIAS